MQNNFDELAGAIIAVLSRLAEFENEPNGRMIAGKSHVLSESHKRLYYNEDDYIKLNYPITYPERWYFHFLYPTEALRVEKDVYDSFDIGDIWS